MAKFRINDEQQSAITHRNGPSRIMAGAGTGKTQTLTERFVALVESGTPAHEILTVTFTAKAAAELRHRILDQLQSSFRDLWVDTFHGLCRRLLNEWNRREDKPPCVFLDEDEALHIVHQAVTAFEPGQRRFYKGVHAEITLARDVKTVIDRTKDQLLTIDDVQNFASVNADERMLDLATAFSLYEQLRKKANALAYSDLVFDVVDRLQNDASLLKETRSRFSQVMVDEFQDVNAGQFHLTQLLAPPDANLCVVGDPNQAIYAFRGGVSEYMRDFEQYYPTAATYHLTTNYRSGQNILDHANRLIAYNASEEPIELVPAQENPASSVLLCTLATEEHEAEWIARQIRALLRDEQNTFAFSDIAILLRSVRRSSDAIQRALALNGIPYQVGKVAGGEYQVVQDILAALRLIIQEITWTDTARLVANRQCEPALLRRIESAIPHAEDRDRMLVLDEDLPQTLPVGAGSAILAMRQFAEELGQHRSLPLPELFYRAMQATPHFSDVLPKSTASFLSELTRIADSLAEAGATPDEFLNQLTDAWDIQTTQQPDNAHGVQIVTVHSAKGLEWNIVFVAGLADGSFPTAFRRDRDLDMDEVKAWCKDNQRFTTPDREALASAYLAEERRLAYVAMTRARQHLLLTAPATIRDRPVSVSPFIAEASGDAVVPAIRHSSRHRLPVTVKDIAARLHSDRREALQTPVNDPNAAKSLSAVLLAEWAANKTPGVNPIRDRRLPAPNDENTMLQFSFSQLESYDNCPRQYFYARVLKVDVGDETVSMTLGSILHRALERLNRQWQDNGVAPSEGAVIATLSECWQEAEFALSGEQDQLHQRSIAMLKRFFIAEHQREIRRRPIAIEEWIGVDYGRHKLTGKIDLVLVDEQGNCELVDFKSGKARNFNTKPAESLQLYLYAHAWHKNADDPLPKTSYYFLRHEEDKGFQSGECWIDKKQIKSHQFEAETAAEMKDRVDDLLSGILHNEFEATPSTDVCPRCPYRRICPDAM